MGARAEDLGQLESGEHLVRLACPIDAETLRADHQVAESWIQLLPPDVDVEARDGRKFRVNSHADVALNTELPLLVDWEHASELKDDTRAAGWVEQLTVDASGRPGIWGRVKWTPKGREDAASQHYRFISPVVRGKKDAEKLFHVSRMSTVALTNRPALRMQGIEMFRETSQRFHFVDESADEDQTMDKLKKALCSAFGIGENATEDEIIAKVKPVVEAAAKGSDASALRQVVDTVTKERNEAVERLSAVEKELSGFRSTAFKREVEAFFDEGGRAGKIPPAARDKWLAFALESPEKFAMFQEVVVPGLPPMALNESAPPSKPPKPGSRHSANKHRYDRAALKRLGYSDEIIAEAEEDTFARRDPFAGPDDEEDDGDDDDDGAGDGDKRDGDGAGEGA